MAESIQLVIAGIQGQFQSIVHERWKQFKLDSLDRYLATKHAHVIGIHDPDYPVLLRELDDAPVVLFCRGRRDLNRRDWVAVVGTRAMTDYGRRVTAELTMGLGPYFGIVSGLAHGVDTVAHKTAVAANLDTVAVLGTAIDRLYPAENRKLAEAICDGGSIISEYPPGAVSKPYHFPQRNRLISGMSRGVVVVEAQKKSGALSTAAHAISQNRELFVVPGPIDSPASEGCLHLIRQGAQCVMCVDDIVSEYATLPITRRAPSHADSVDVPSGPYPDPVGLSDTEQLIWNALGAGAMGIDDLVVASGKSVPEILSTLTILDINGWIEVQAGSRYARRVKH